MVERPAGSKRRVEGSAAWLELATVLDAHLMPILSRGVLRRLTETGVDPNTLGRPELGKLIPQLEVMLRLFVEPESLTAATRAVRQLTGERSPLPRALTVEIVQESDIREARVRARTLCELVRARPLAIQRAATVASELARNIYNYAGKGSIELALHDEERPELHILAIDSGPGIGNLEEILDGRYRSKTGLGKGLLGVRRLTSQFRIQSDGGGTRVEAVVSLVEGTPLAGLVTRRR